VSAATLNMTPMECWVTLPAIWSEEAKNATLQAAKRAGFGSRPGDEIFTIAEPEAAAIATLKKFSNPNTLNCLTVRFFDLSISFQSRANTFMARSTNTF